MLFEMFNLLIVKFTDLDVQKLRNSSLYTYEYMYEIGPLLTCT